MIKIFTQTSIACFLLATTSLAQEQLEAVTISDKSILSDQIQYKNQSTLTLDKASIAKLPYQTIDAILKHVPGLDIRTRGMNGVQSDISIDGGTFDQCLVLLNGHPLSDPQTGHNLLLLPIHTLDIEQIQIIKGPVSSIYGVNALSGVINIITNQIAPNYVGVQAGTGSLGAAADTFYANYGVQTGLHFGKKNLRQSLHAGYDQGNGYRSNTAYKTLHAFSQTNFQHQDFKASLQLGYKFSDFGASGFYAAPGDSLSSESINHFLSGIKLSQRIYPNVVLEARVSYNYKSDDYWYLATPDRARNVHYQNNLSALVNANIKSSIGTLNLALSQKYEQLNSTNLGQRERSFYSLILNYNKLFAEKFMLEATVNANYYKDALHWFPSLGLGYFLNANHKLYANVGTAERLPSFTDLYYSLPNVIHGNPNLVAEQAISFEVGYQMKAQNRSLQMYYYNRRVHQFIDWVKADVNDAWQPQNYHNVQLHGFTLQWRHQLPVEGKVFNEPYYNVGYNYLNPSVTVTQEQILSRYAINALQHQMIIGVGSKLGANWNWYIGARYNDRIAYQAYWLLDAKIGLQLSQHRLHLNIQNATNTQIVEAGANPIVGRWLGVSYTYQF